MASKTLDLPLPLPPDQAYQLVRKAGSELPGFRLIGDFPHEYRLMFSRGMGWTNPVEVAVAVYQVPEGAGARFTASILALADPFGFLPSVLGLFEAHVQNHVEALRTGQPVPPPPRDTRGRNVTLWLVGGVLVLAVALVSCVVLANALR